MNLIWLASIVFSLVGMGYCERLSVSYLWIRKQRKFASKRQNRNFFIVIPVIDEVARLPQTVKYFIEKFCKSRKVILCLVTTEREKAYFKSNTEKYLSVLNDLKDASDLQIFAQNHLLGTIKKQTKVNNLTRSAIRKLILDREDTIDCVRNLCRKYPNQVTTYHYPHENGKMAHQINFAVKGICAEKNVGSRDFFGIYNADSKPHPKTLDYIDTFASTQTDLAVFQQHGNYLKNHIVLTKNFWTGSVLFSAALWQTRWSLAIEMYNTFRQLPAQKLPQLVRRFLYPANYCVGHGLFFTRAVYEKVTCLSEVTMNEDAEFGLELNQLEIPITPIPFFDLSDSPDSIRSLFIQKSIWFFSPLQSYVYYRIIINKHKGDIDRLKLAILSARFLMFAIYWLIGPIIFFGILLGFRSTLALWILAYLFYLIIPDLFAYLLILEMEQDESLKKRRLSYIPQIVIGSGLAYLLHGLSALRAIGLATRKHFTGKEIQKNRTEMNHTS
ncbi:hypothetical protein COT78_03200 [Candidatus Berkelbacteria bacterium CG10_big_fil_rev_8_21_14_0_10_43_13]|uniref:Glycosyltransferase 2-like domain-containing protein n=1 Tax=Candidatus Berkelbacteria bacterium CG10_big_fil_rev_8_21_14_0_10_43_13 TaxID=1974514 RepID=A0A2H0W5Z2_9BACT|nr:MAG: hypothetical protein COT78_03200 [Candidatus Berkelbacteria bacterium CG10_big_fil_rev_8_21_14_0_10_43_13]